MPRKRVTKNKNVALPVLNPDAAGIDIGATEIYVAVPGDRDPEPIRMFGTFTQDLNQLADWLQQCHVHTVGMESTGVYWIPLMQILESRGLEVLPSQCQARQKRSWSPHRCFRLSMAAVSPFRWLAARFLPPPTGCLLDS